MSNYPANLTEKVGTRFVQYGHDKNVTLISGYVQSPNGRGTIDIVWSCLFTIFLCSWSILCLNLPAIGEGYWHRARRKFNWTLLTVMGPEVVFQLSLGEWLVARRMTKEMRALDLPGKWTLTHSFYANMGGFLLRTSDQGTFPINCVQLHHLLKHNFVEYPKLNRKAILDKNKAEKVVRVLTMGQTLWFLLSCIGRAAQSLTLTTLELSTLAFISSAVGSFYCWYHKPMDVEVPEYIDLRVSVLEVLQHSNIDASSYLEEYTRTPLEFIDRRREWPWNVYWQYGMNLLRTTMKMPWLILYPKTRPVQRIADDYWPEPTLQSLPALFFFHVAYAAILMAGWNLDLPTYVELTLWRVASAIQLGTIVSAWFTMPLQITSVGPRFTRILGRHREPSQSYGQSAEVRASPTSRSGSKDGTPSPKLARLFSMQSVNSIQGDLESRAEKARGFVNNGDPHWRASIRLLVVYEFTWLIYLLSRLYIIAEDFASLRAMPESAYSTVNWNTYIPHI